MPASVRQNRVICGETEYSYREARGETAAQLTVLWNRDTFIGQTNVTLYKCSLLGSHGGRGDCSLCASRDPRYDCSWCGGQCSYGPTCSEPVQTTCPPPRIDWVSTLRTNKKCITTPNEFHEVFTIFTNSCIKVMLLDFNMYLLIISMFKIFINEFPQ